MDSWMSVLLLAALLAVAAVVRQVFRAGAPAGQSSVRADGNAAEAGHGTDDFDTLRQRHHTNAR